MPAAEAAAFEWGTAATLAQVTPFVSNAVNPAGKIRRAPAPEFGADAPSPLEPEAAPESASGREAGSEPGVESDRPDSASHQAHLAALERDAFAKGYAAGERAGAEAGATRADAMLRRLAQTLEEIGSLRHTMVHQTERQMVQLAIAVARRVVGREIALDADLIVAMARVALDRLGEGTPAVVRLHPDDLAAIGAPAWVGPQVQIVADAGLNRGACVVQSEFGFIDAGVDAQFEQIAQAMLGDVAAPPERVVPLRRAS